MTYIDMPADQTRRLSFYLAMEEYVARTMPSGDYFFMWQVAPSVIFGRNQQMESEVNVDYCRQHGIQLYRRKSGGGCMMLLVLRQLGVQATSTSHNDVMIGDRKVCGTAFYHLPHRSIVHSTLLYDTNMEHMLHAITPSADKLQKKGIQSVRQRITLLKDHVSLSLEEVKAHIRHTLCEDSCRLTPDQVAGIEQVEQQYLENEFIHLL